MEEAVKVIVTCGHPESGFHEILFAAELARAQPSQVEAISATALQEKLLRARESSLAKALTADHRLSNGLWHDLAGDLFNGNSTGIRTDDAASGPCHGRANRQNL